MSWRRNQGCRKMLCNTSVLKRNVMVLLSQIFLPLLICLPLNSILFFNGRRPGESGSNNCYCINNNCMETKKEYPRFKGTKPLVKGTSISQPLHTKTIEFLSCRVERLDFTIVVAKQLMLHRLLGRYLSCSMKM